MPRPSATCCAPGQLLGRYDARIAAPLGSSLAAQGDPSSTLIGAPFAAAAKSRFVDELKYSASATYVTLSNAIDSWDFSHDGRALPDTVPDLAAALTLQPTLRTLSISGYHDLATPFRQTELDLARIAEPSRLDVRAYPGGHMTYLDDGSRQRHPRRRRRLAAGAVAARLFGSVDLCRPGAARRRDRRPARSATGRPGACAGRRRAERRNPANWCKAGDPWVPPALRVAPAGPSPQGPALKALVERKVAERLASPYR